MEKYFYKAFSWCFEQPWVVETTSAGVINNALSHIECATCKEDFVCGLARGFHANLTAPAQKEFLDTLSK